jgi:uncharacterized protein (TIGR02145 family)
MEEKVSIFTLLLIVFAVLATGCKKDKKPTELLTDMEGNSYKTVTIGSQVWMAENLKTTKFVDGSDIPLIEDASSWGNLTTPGYCWYNNDPLTFKEPYGALYNDFTVATGKLCPTGWHVPEKEEWQKLRDYLGDSIQAGAKLKEPGTAHWLSPNKGADNSSGFTALGAGLRYFEGTFASINSFTSFWSATAISTDDEWYCGLYFGDTAFIIDHRNRKHGFSVRCLKD